MQLTKKGSSSNRCAFHQLPPQQFVRCTVAVRRPMLVSSRNCISILIFIASKKRVIRKRWYFFNQKNRLKVHGPVIRFYSIFNNKIAIVLRKKSFEEGMIIEQEERNPKLTYLDIFIVRFYSVL